MNGSQHRATPRRVDFSMNEWDLECALLAEAGWSTKAIADRTGLTPGQVSLRCHQAGIKRSTYRNGESKMSKLVLDLLTHQGDKAYQEKVIIRLPRMTEQFQNEYTRHREDLRAQQRRAVG